MTYIRSGYFAFVLLLIGSIFSVPAQAGIGDACTVANRIHTSEGATTDVLICDGATMTQQTARSLKGNPIREGIRTGSPEATLDVNGEVKIGNTSLACSGTTEGSLRYNTTSNSIELCDGSSWAAVSVGACGDAMPDALSFTDLVNQSTSTLVTSNIDQVTGISCTVGITVTGEGSPQFRTCSDSGCSTVLTDWTTSGTIDNNSYAQLRLTTSAAGADTYSATLSVGTYAIVWNATPAGDCTGSPAAGTVCADGTVYAGLSPDGNVKMYVTRCDAGMSWNGTTCTGTRFALPWNSGTTNWVTTGYTSSVTGEANTTNIAPIDSDSVLAGTQDHAAVVHCNGLTENGNSDWYLPALSELDIIYGNRAAIANFNTSGTYYYSSTENGTNGANAVRFSDGAHQNHSKASSYLVRCARR